MTHKPMRPRITIAVSRGARLAREVAFPLIAGERDLAMASDLTPGQRRDLARALHFLRGWLDLAAAQEWELPPAPSLAERLDGDHPIRRRRVRTDGLQKHLARRRRGRPQLAPEPLAVVTTSAAQLKPKRPPVRGFGAGAELARLQRGGH